MEAPVRGKDTPEKDWKDEQAKYKKQLAKAKGRFSNNLFMANEVWE